MTIVQSQGYEAASTSWCANNADAVGHSQVDELWPPFADEARAWATTHQTLTWPTLASAPYAGHWKLRWSCADSYAGNAPLQHRSERSQTWSWQLPPIGAICYDPWPHRASMPAPACSHQKWVQAQTAHVHQPPCPRSEGKSLIVGADLNRRMSRSQVGRHHGVAPPLRPEHRPPSLLRTTSLVALSHHHLPTRQLHQRTHHSTGLQGSSGASTHHLTRLRGWDPMGTHRVSL
eukprot:6491107-Amphidinium_carterae.3